MGLCLLVNLLVVAGIMFGRNARDSLFLVYFGVQYLPYMYFANAAFLILCSIVYTLLVDRIERGKFLAGVSSVFVASLAASRLILFKPPHLFFPVLYIEAQVIWYFSLMQFWTFAGDLFDTRQAKRLFPLLAVGGLLGMISVGLGSSRIVRALGTENLILVWAGLIFVSLILGGTVYRRYRLAPEPAQVDAASVAKGRRPSEWQKIKDGLREVGRQPLLRSMAGYILFMWTVYAIVDFCFNQTMRQRYSNPNDLTTFFGMFVGVQGLACLTVQLFVTRRVIAGQGVGTTINFHPTLLILGSAWMSLHYAYPSVLSTKLADAIMLYTFSDSSYQLLYNPIAPERRARVRGFIEGYIRPVSLAAAGALVLVGNKYLKPLQFAGLQIPTGQQLSWGALTVAGIWLAIALTAKKGYIHALLENIQKGAPALREAAANALAKLKDPRSLSLLSDALRSDSPDRVVTALQFLETFGTEEAAQAIAGLVGHSHPRVRATAVATLGRLDAKKYSEVILPLLEDPDARVRSNSIEALAAAREPKLLEKLRPLLQDASTRPRVNTVLTIAATQGVSAALEWMPLISSLARGDADSRASAAYALGRLPLEPSMDLLAKLLDDSELRIRCEAAQALGRIGSPRIIPALIEALSGPADLRHYARRAIAAIIGKHDGIAARDLANAAANSPRPEIRSELADVLGRLKGQEVIDTLIKLLKDPEWRVQWKVLKSFSRLARDGPLPESARLALFDYAHDELAAFRTSVLCSQVLVPQPLDWGEQVLAQALEEDRMNIEERVFQMLGILCGRDRMLAIFQKLRSGDSRQRADALEALDTLAPKKIGQQVLALLEPAPDAKDTANVSRESLLDLLAGHSKPWVRACTAYYLGLNAQKDGARLLKTLVRDRNPLVGETALVSGWRAFRDSWRPQVEAFGHSTEPVFRRRAHQILAGQFNNPVGPGLVQQRGEAMMLTVEKALFLKSVPVFAGLEGEELAALAEIAMEKEFRQGEVLFEEGQVAHHLYLVVRGKVEVFRKVNSNERPLAALAEKDVLGEMAILDDEPRSASVRALEPTLVLKIDRESFRELIHERPQISFAIFKMLSSRLRQRNLEADNLPNFEAGKQYA